MGDMNVNMDKKISFFDIDGTLMGSYELLPDSTVEAIRKSRAAGNLCYICSGRSRSMMPEKVMAIGFDGIVCGGGTYVSKFVDGGEKVISDVRLNPEQVARIVKWLGGSDVALFFEGMEKIYAMPIYSYAHPDEFAAFLKVLTAPIADIDVEHPETVHAAKFSGMVSHDQWDYVMDMARDVSDFMHMIVHAEPNSEATSENGGLFAGYGFVEFLPNGMNKAVGIDRVLSAEGIPLENAYAFGDSMNDREMLEHVPNSICMGNGNEEVKKIASYVTASLEEDGIYKAMEHFGLF